jgi:hypothetical protein
VADTRETVEECPKLGSKAEIGSKVGPSVRASAAAGAEENVIQAGQTYADNSRADSRQHATESSQTRGRRQAEVTKVGRTPANEKENLKSWSKQVMLWPVNTTKHRTSCNSSMKNTSTLSKGRVCVNFQSK